MSVLSRYTHELVCGATPRPRRGRFVLAYSSMSLPFTSPHYNRARQQDPRVGVAPESVKLLIGVHYNVIPLLLEPALSLLGADTLFPSCTNQPARHLLYPYKPLSLLLGMRNIHSYPQAHYFTPRLFSLPNSRLKHCRDLIFVR